MHRRKMEMAFAIAVVCVGLILGGLLIWRLWSLDQNGFSPLSRRLPYWDFTNLWAGTRLALTGHVSSLFDVGAYRAEIRALFSPLMPDQEWSYPPSMLLVGLPFALLPILPAYWAWTGATLALLFLAARLLGLSPTVALLVVVSPGAFVDVILGQNGALTTFLLIAGLRMVSTRPLIGGLLLGLLTIKPQIGLLVPFCLVAGRHWEAILVAVAVAVLLVLVSGNCFGFDTWLLFATVTRPLMTAILEAPFPQGYQMNAMTFFIMARAAGAGLAAAYAIQGVFLAIAAVIAMWLWSGMARVADAERVVVTALLGLLATPYGYVYDAISLNLAAAYFFQRRCGGLPVIALAWLYPIVNNQISPSLAPVGVLVPLAMILWALRQIWNDQRASAVPTGEKPSGRSFSKLP